MNFPLHNLKDKTSLEQTRKKKHEPLSPKAIPPESKMCHDDVSLFACGHPAHIIPDPCRRLVTTNFCTGIVRDVKVLSHPCGLCPGNIWKLRELSGRRSPGQQEETGVPKKGDKQECGLPKKGNGDEGGSAEDDAKDGGVRKESGEYTPFEKKCYTEEAFKDLMKECHKRVWSRYWEG